MEDDNESLVTEFTRRAVKLAKRDGIPPVGSDEIRLHSQLANDRYICSDKVMVSFRTPNGAPVALLEQLWADGERTRIVARSAVAVNPENGQPYDMKLFFQSCPGDFTSILATAERTLDGARKQKRRENSHRGLGKMNAHVVARLAARGDYCRSLVECFKRAAHVLGVSPSEKWLASNRNLYRIHPSSRLVSCESLPAKTCG